jgi:hypothetical protein
MCVPAMDDDHGVSSLPRQLKQHQFQRSERIEREDEE